MTDKNVTEQSVTLQFRPFAILIAVLLFLAGFLLGGLYMHTVTQGKADMQHLQDVIDRYHDWERFSAHVREDQRRFGARRIQFHSDIYLASHKPAMAAQHGAFSRAPVKQAEASKPAPAASNSNSAPAPPSASPSGTAGALPEAAPVAEQPLVQAEVEHLQLVGDDGSESRYVVQVTLTNVQGGSEVLAPSNLELQDQNGKTYTAYQASPPLPDGGIASNVSYQTELYFLIPHESIPQKLIVAGASSSEVTPLR